MMRPNLATLAAGAFLTAALLTGCGSADDPVPQGTSTSSPQSGSGTSGSTEPSGQAFADCMRGHGVDMSDPDPSTGIPEFGDSVDPASSEVQAALDACQDLMPGGVRGQQDEQDLGVYLAFSECMRENGLPDFPDPQPGPNGMFGDSGVDRNDPAYQQAAAACHDVLAGE